MTRAVPKGSLEDELLRPRPRRLSPELVERWETSLGTWGASPRALESCRALLNPATRIVITGQQPGPWGGALYTFYKAATAVALAEELTAQDGAPAVAVFWMQTEDTDWGEVGWGALPHPDLRLLRHRFLPVLPGRHWIGSARLTDPPEAVALVREWGVESTGGLLPRADGYELASSFAETLLGVFGDRGLLPLDGRWPEIRVGGRDLWECYLPRHADLALDVTALGGEGPRRAVLDLEAASRGLFVLDGERRRPIDPGTWEAEVTEVLRTEPLRLAPSVLLRAPLQDHVFGPAAHVVGRGEAAYLEQLAPVYDALRIEAPRRVPRLSATVFPKGLVSSTDCERVLEDPETWIAERAALQVPEEARKLVLETRHRLEASALRLEELLGDEQESREGVGTLRKKIDLELKRIEETLERRGRRELYRHDARMRHLAEFLRPRRSPQERGISGGMLPLVFGDAAWSMLLQAARDHVDAWRQGQTHSFDLEATRV